MGCNESGKEDWETTIASVPGVLDVDSSNQLYFIEKLTFSLWKIDLNQPERNYTWQVVSSQGEAQSFFARGLAIGRLPGEDVLLSCGIYIPGNNNPSFSALVALSTQEVNPGVELGSFVSSYRNTLLAIYGPLAGPSAMDSLTLNAATGVIRIFLIDEISWGNGNDKIFDSIKVFDFDYNETAPAQSGFSTAYTISSPGGAPCSDIFFRPSGLAVDPDDNALYVVDRISNKLFRFSGIDGPSPSCDGEISSWGSGLEEQLFDPKGIAVLSGQMPLTDNIIYVADEGNARVAAFRWNGSAFTLFDTIPTPLDVPIDLAVDTAENLWGAFPDIGRVDIIAK